MDAWDIEYAEARWSRTWIWTQSAPMTELKVKSNGLKSIILEKVAIPMLRSCKPNSNKILIKCITKSSPRCNGENDHDESLPYSHGNTINFPWSSLYICICHGHSCRRYRDCGHGSRQGRHDEIIHRGIPGDTQAIQWFSSIIIFSWTVYIYKI